MAGMTNQYPNLPGHLVEFKDGGLALRSDISAVQTDSVLLLGTAVDGPVMEPVAIDINTLETVFGKEINANGAPNGSTLVKAAKELYENGVRDIRLMRVTGTRAKASLKKTPETLTTVETSTEELGYAEGNDLTTIQLQNGTIVQASTKVYAKGVLITGGVTVNETDGQVILAPNVCDAGASLQVQYDHYRTTEVVKETHLLDEETSLELAYEPKGAIHVFVGGLEIAEAGYQVTDRTVKITTYAVGNPAQAGDEIEVDYTGITTDVFHATESGDGVTPYTAATSLQSKTIAHTPVSGSVHVYVNGVEMTNPIAFIVDATAKVVKLEKKFYPIGSQIAVTYGYEDVQLVERNIEISSYFAGEVYNQSTVIVEDILDTNGDVAGKTVKIIKPLSKRKQVVEQPMVFTSIDYPTFGQLVEAINGDYSNGVYRAQTVFPDALVSELVSNLAEGGADGVNFIGGDNGITTDKTKLFEALSGVRDSEGFVSVQGAYQLLEDYQTDWVVPLGVYADDVLPGRYQNFAYELGLFCTVLSYRSKITLGAIDVRPATDTSLAGIQAHANKLANMPNTYLMRDEVGNIIIDNDGKPIDLGSFLTVVGSPEPVYQSRALGRSYGSPAVAYVGLNAVIPVHSAPTNKRLAGVRGLRYRLSNPQMNAILGNRIVVFKTKFDQQGSNAGAAYVVDGITSAAVGSDYARLTTTKVIRETVDQIRDVSEPYIGEANTTEQMNALSAAISKRLGLLKEKGVILDYDFIVTSSVQDQVLGQARIELTIVPPQELRRITTVVGLKAS